MKFSDALKRTAQLCYDLHWPGIPITYSWPSCAKTRLYPADEASIDATVPFLLDFLERLTGRDKLRALHVVCHSMGARALTRALATLTGGRLSRRPLINEVVLAAPDIDGQVFAQLAAVIRSKCDRITLYASSKDLALVASRTLHAFPRAGESGPNMVIFPELLDTVDATAVDTNLLGHSYYGDERSIIADLFGRELTRATREPVWIAASNVFQRALLGFPAVRMLARKPRIAGDRRARQQGGADHLGGSRSA